MLVALLPNFSVIWSHISEDTYNIFCDELATPGHYLCKFFDTDHNLMMGKILNNCIDCKLSHKELRTAFFVQNSVLMKYWLSAKIHRFLQHIHFLQNKALLVRVIDIYGLWSLLDDRGPKN